MGERRIAYKVLWRNLREGDQFEDPGIGRIVLRHNSRKWYGGAWTGLMVQDEDSWRSLGNVVMNLQVT
jgi:hypothetical protein